MESYGWSLTLISKELPFDTLPGATVTNSPTARTPNLEPFSLRSRLKLLSFSVVERESFLMSSKVVMAVRFSLVWLVGVFLRLQCSTCWRDAREENPGPATLGPGFSCLRACAING